MTNCSHSTFEACCCHMQGPVCSAESSRCPFAGQVQGPILSKLSTGRGWGRAAAIGDDSRF